MDCGVACSFFRFSILLSELNNTVLINIFRDLRNSRLSYFIFEIASLHDFVIKFAFLSLNVCFSPFSNFEAGFLYDIVTPDTKLHHEIHLPVR